MGAPPLMQPGTRKCIGSTFGRRRFPALRGKLTPWQAIRIARGVCPYGDNGRDVSYQSQLTKKPGIEIVGYCPKHGLVRVDITAKDNELAIRITSKRSDEITVRPIGCQPCNEQAA